MTTFKGHKTGFKPGKTNACVPNASGPPATKFKGRGGLPEGPLKRYPGGATAIDNGNRRLAKSNVGDGAGSGTTFNSRTAFGRGGK
jgi:hypothetical protein